MTRISPAQRDWWVVCTQCTWLNEIISDTDYDEPSDARREAQDLQNEHALTIGHSDIYRIRLRGEGDLA